MFTTKNLLMLVGRHALIALVAISTATLAMWFFSRKIEHTASGVIQNYRLVNTLEKRTELFSMIKRDVNIVGTNDTLIEQAFLSSDNILEFTEALKSVAFKNSIAQNLNLEGPVLSPQTAPFPIATVSYSSSLEGNLQAFSNYLKDFERLPYFTKIESINISSQDTAGLRGISTASFRATLYTKAAQ